MREEIVKQCLAGKPLFGKDGALAPMIQSVLNAVLEGEMDAHLTEEERQSGNRRNGKMEKQVQTPYGEVSVSTSRDRNGTFDPQFIKKRVTVLAEGSADKIIGLYALGASTRKISSWFEENVGSSISAETISAITDRVLPEIKEWKSRQLDEVYAIVWLDAIHYKVKDEKGQAVAVLYIMYLESTRKGKKTCLACMFLIVKAPTFG